jgi:26S proteasome regulatory subunit, ATPase 3, interacting protein
VITESERVKIEDAFLKGMEAWLDRRRKFNNLFETVLEGTGEKKQKLWGGYRRRD